MLRPPLEPPLKVTTRSSTLSPDLRPLVIWVSPVDTWPVVTARTTCFPPVTTVTCALPPE